MMMQRPAATTTETVRLRRRTCQQERSVVSAGSTPSRTATVSQRDAPLAVVGLHEHIPELDRLSADVPPESMVAMRSVHIRTVDDRRRLERRTGRAIDCRGS